MKLLQMRLPLFICLLLFLSTAKANNSSSQNSFEFSNITLENATAVGNGLAGHPLSHNSFEFLNTSIENAPFVENGLTLLKNTGVLSGSMLINTGIWWAACKARGFISGAADKYQLIDLEKQGDGAIKSDFCGQLALLITTAETALAGQVSPWPVDLLWWRAVFLMGAVLTAYSSIDWDGAQPTPQNIATTALAYLVADSVSRTASNAVSTTILKDVGKIHIEETDYYAGQYFALAMISGVITGSIIYKMLLHRGVSHAIADLVSTSSAAVASALSQTMSMYNAGLNIRDYVFWVLWTVAGTAALTAGITEVDARAGAGAGIAAAIAAGFAALAGAIAGADAGALAGAEAEAGFEAAARFGAGVAINAGVLAGAAAGAIYIMGIDKLAPKKLSLKFAGAVITTTSVLLINSLSGFAAYGYPLEQSLSKTTQTLWNKFLAPLDYIATLFPQLLSKHELEE